MLKKNIREIERVKIGDRVLLRVPDVDRGPLDPNNVVCLALEERHGLFKLGCQVGVLDKYYAYNYFFKLFNYFKQSWNVRLKKKILQKLSIKKEIERTIMFCLVYEKW